MRVEPLDENELALYQRLKEITDSRRLNAMMPAWIKAHNRAIAAPKPLVFVPDQPPKYPHLPTGQQWYAANNWQYGHDGKIDRTFPGWADAKAGILQYIAAFEQLNGLKPCPTELVNS